MQRVYGLVGKELSHSFSKSYFEKKFRDLGLNDCVYLNFELQDIREWPRLRLEQKGLKGVNVTLPYKESILPFLDEIDEEARSIGAVNCVKLNNGHCTGYNTDVYGFTQSIKPFLDYNHQRALVLGTGGAAKAVSFALKNIGVDVLNVTSTLSKKNQQVLHYSELNEYVLDAHKLVVNCSPLGMFPDTGTCPDLPYDCFTPQHLAYDLVYNPEHSVFLKKAGERGAITVNGYSMLQLQAEKSWEIWNRE